MAAARSLPRWPLPNELIPYPPDRLTRSELAQIARDIDAGRVPMLSVRQPWAHYILRYGKDVENRTWQTRYRGRVLLHAPLKAMADATPDMPRGCVIGLAEIIDCVTEHDSPWFAGPVGLVLGRRIELSAVISAKGAPRLSLRQASHLGASITAILSQLNWLSGPLSSARRVAKRVKTI